MEVGCSPYLDLLTEVEEVSTLGQFKVTQLDFSHYLGDVEGGGLPSLCLPDGLLPQDLFGDPMLPLPQQEQDAPPAAPHPETLISVSLPAGQLPASCPASPRPRSPAATYPSPASPRPRSPAATYLSPASPRPHSPATTYPSPASSRPCSPAAFNCSPPEEETATLSPTQPQAPPSPVRVVVRTGSMVAPVSLEKSSRILVKIPQCSPPQPSPTLTVSRRRVLRSRGKVGPAAAALSHPTEVPQCSASHTPELQTPIHTNTNTTCTTFRSLADRGVRQGCSSSRKRKAYELEPQDDPEMERCRLNAINARRNRELKKAHMAELERRAEEVDRERQRLAEENERLREDNTRLQREVGHLTGVLRNQSRLSHILDKVSPTRLTLGDATPLEEEKKESARVSTGVCLHLDGDEATLECCSLCAKKASKKLKHYT